MIFNIRKIFIIILFFAFLPTKAFANILNDPGKLSDLLQVIDVSYVAGMAIMEKDNTGIKEYAKALLSTQLTVEGLKALKLERRPDGSNWRSFPSGHTAAVFTAAFFAHKRYGLRAAAIPYAIAYLTAAQRVFCKAHYTHDVIFGAAIAGLFNYFFVDKYSNFSLYSGDKMIGGTYRITF